MITRLLGGAVYLQLSIQGKSRQPFSYKPFPTMLEAVLAQTRVGGNRQIFVLRAGKQPTNCCLNTSGPPFSKQFPNRFIGADSLLFIFIEEHLCIFVHDASDRLPDKHFRNSINIWSFKIQLIEIALWTLVHNGPAMAHLHISHRQDGRYITTSELIS